MGYFVYILNEADTDCFKLGISNQLGDRFNRLSKLHEFDLDRSYLVEVVPGHARKLESALHREYSHSRVRRCNDVGRLLDGGSEWFRKSCLNSCLYAIDQSASGYSRPITGEHIIKSFWKWQGDPSTLESMSFKTLNRPGMTMFSYEGKFGELYESDQIFFKKARDIFKLQKAKLAL